MVVLKLANIPLMLVLRGIRGSASLDFVTNPFLNANRNS
jgi:hypothetical protein